MLNVNRLRVLREVANRRSFSAAADALSYTQSAVSQQIATLEAETQTTLIERRSRGLRLTAAGELLVEHTEGIIARLEAAQAALEEIAGVRGGRLRIASFPTAGATLMPLAIATFRSRFPAVELTLAEGEPQDIGPRLEAGEFDLALLFEFPRAGRRLGPEIRRVELLEDPMYLALPEAHRLAAAQTLRLADLRDEAWVQTSAPSPCARHVVRSCHAAGFEPNVAFESDDYQTVQGLVGAGVGVALIPELALAHVRGDIAIREISPRSPVRRVTVATPKDALTPAAEAMLAILEEAAAGYAGRRRPNVSRQATTSPDAGG
ncbi:MAG TPA: LysR family transcriptional regulator [Solirubrobacteraceae bacterium]